MITIAGTIDAESRIEGKVVIEAGAVTYLPKGCSNERLRATLEAAVTVAGGARLNPNALNKIIATTDLSFQVVFENSGDSTETGVEVFYVDPTVDLGDPSVTLHPVASGRHYVVLPATHPLAGHAAVAGEVGDQGVCVLMQAQRHQPAADDQQEHVDPDVAVWVGYDNAEGKARTLGTGATGGQIAVPIFENRTLRRELEFPLTEAVVREIQVRTFSTCRSGSAACSHVRGSSQDGLPSPVKKLNRHVSQ